MIFFWIPKILCEFFGTIFNTTKLAIINITTLHFKYVSILQDYKRNIRKFPIYENKIDLVVIFNK